MDTNKEMLTINNLNYKYKSNWAGKPTHAIKNISLSINNGETFGVYGPSKSGKTTIFKCLVGLIKPYSGEIKIQNKHQSLASSRKELGFVAEHPNFYENLKVHELLKMFCVLSEVENKTDELLNRIGLEESKNQKISILNRSAIKLIAIAQALAGNPKLLLLDNPFSELEPAARDNCENILLDYINNGGTVLIGSDNILDLVNLCDRIAILERGQITNTMTSNQILDKISPSYILTINKSAQYADKLIGLSESSRVGRELIKLYFNGSESAENALKFSLENKISISNFELINGKLNI